MKTKNKKLFALLMLPAVIAMMVLPLCSFTTVYNTNEYQKYSSQTNVGARYTYEYGTTGNYYGLLQDMASVLTDGNGYSLTARNKSIKFTACDYYITSSSRIQIKNVNDYFGEAGPLFEIPELSNPGGIYDYQLCLLYDCNNANVYFNGEFHFDDFSFDDNIGIYFIDNNVTNDVYSLSGKRLYINLEFDYACLARTSDDGVYVVNTHIVDTFDTIYDWPALYIEEFIDESLNEISYEYQSDSNLIDQITDVKFTVLVYDDLTGETLNNSKHDRIIIMSNVYDVDNYDDTPFLITLDQMFGSGSMYDSGFRAGKIAGINLGLSKAPSVWGSIGDFLISTAGSFFSVELWDGFSLGGVMAIIVGALLFVAFLKVFAGG